MAFNNSGFSAIAFALMCGTARALTTAAPVLETYSYWGQWAFGPCLAPWLSRDARFLLFSCGADDIVEGDSNERSDGFILDRFTRETQRFSVDSLGLEHRFHSGPGVSSNDGRQIVFWSTAPLDPVIPWNYPENGISNAFLRDTTNSTTTLISLDAMGHSMEGGVSLPSVNHIRKEALLFTQLNLIGNDQNGPFNYDLFLRNWQTETIELISVSPDGLQGNCSSGPTAAMSENGRYVVFPSCASNLTDDNPLGLTNLFVRDRWLQTTRRLTWPWIGGEFTTSQSFIFGLWSNLLVDNRLASFYAYGAELAPGTGSIRPNSYIINVETGHLELISTSWDGSSNPDGGASIALSGDGRYVAFASRSASITPTPGPVPAVYVKDRLTGEIANISASLGPSGNTLPEVVISEDGSTVAFSWQYGETAPPDWIGRVHIYTVAIGSPPAGPTTAEPVSSLSLLGRIGGIVVLLLTGAWMTRSRS